MCFFRQQKLNVQQILKKMLNHINNQRNANLDHCMLPFGEVLQ